MPAWSPPLRFHSADYDAAVFNFTNGADLYQLRITNYDPPTWGLMQVADFGDGQVVGDWLDFEFLDLRGLPDEAEDDKVKGLFDWLECKHGRRP